MKTHPAIEVPTPDPLAPLRRRLDKWELQHLRTHALELAERLERAEEESVRAWESAELWRENAFELQQALMDDGATIGITQAGQMIALKDAPALNAGETYLGAIISADGTHSHHTILLPGYHDDATWQDAMDWAKSIGGDLPNRVEQALLFATLKDQFQKDWYWSNTLHASGASSAWIQSFSGGDQSISHILGQCRARAVRRLPFQPFVNLS